MDYSIDTQTNKVIETTPQPSIVREFSIAEYDEKLTRLDSDEQIENDRHAKAIADIVSDRAIAQAGKDYGIANGLV